MFWLELVVVLAAIVIGARVGGAGLGTVAAIGLAVLVLGFGLPPSSPPVTVLAIVVAVVTAAAAMQAAGGLDVLVALAEKALRKKPEWITFVAPIVAYAFTFCSGTGHVAYAVLPVIAEVSRKAGIRPERPMSISVIASQQAITASPLAAATVGLLGVLDAANLQVNGSKVELWHILAVCIPSTLIGVIAGALSVYWKGKELKDDPAAQAAMTAALAKAEKKKDGTIVAAEAPSHGKAVASVAVFFVAAALIVAFGMAPGIRPTYMQAVKPADSVPISTVENAIFRLMDREAPDPMISKADVASALERAKQKAREGPAEKEVSVAMPMLIQVVMLGAAGIMMLFLGARPGRAVSSPVGAAGVVAFISILGLGWMGNCFFDGNKEFIVSSLSEVIQARPWIFAVGLFGLSILLFSQASTVAALMPLGVSLGLPASSLIAMFPAVNGYFFLPTYGTIVAAVAFDTTGTTRLGRWVLDHSFMRPGLVATVVSVAAGYAIAGVVL